MKKLIVLNLLGLALVSVLAAWLWQNARSSSRALTGLGGYTEVERQANEIRAQMITMSDAMRGFLLNPSNREEFERKKAADRALGEAVNALLAATTNRGYSDLAKRIGDLDEQQLDPIENRVLDLAARDPKAATATYFNQYLPIRVEQMALVEQLRKLAASDMAAEMRSAGDGAAWTTALVTWLGGSVVLAMIGAFFWSARTTRRVQAQIALETATMFDAATGVLEAARAASQSAQTLSRGASQQAASLEETSASMTEVASVTRLNAEHSQEAASVMIEMDDHVRTSNGALGEAVASMNALQESSEQVARIIKTIDDIAFQTNLLALNAAVEAARAGDAGMGFAIVADEVRSLAQRSAQAAKDTERLIETSIEKTAAGSARVSQVARAITDITASVVTVKRLVDAVATASHQQSHGIEQVAQAVRQMEQVTQTNAATAEESAASGEELNARAETALDVVRRLETLIGLTQRPAQRGAARAGTAAPGLAPSLGATATSTNRDRRRIGRVRRAA